MIPSEITTYCEMIAIYNKEIAAEVAAKRRKMLETRQQYVIGAAQEAKNLPVPVVTITFEDGSKWDVLDPEKWVACYKKTKLSYRKFVEESIPEALELYYDKGKLCTESYVKAGVSRTKFFEQRRKFIWMLSMYAIQDKLIMLDE